MSDIITERKSQRIDWNGLWKETHGDPDRANNIEFWNSFAPKFRKKTDGPDPYIEKFYEYMNPKPGDTLFDMGCGSGTLAIPFAQKGHEIYAADFSPEMLKYLRIGAEEAGVSDRIHTIQLNWNEDWSSRELPECDIAFSSRSIITTDLTQALRNLESVATRKICMGVWDTPVSDYDRYVAKAIGYERPGIGPHYIVMGELMDRDVFPEMRILYSPFRNSKYSDREDACSKIRASFNDLTKDQSEKLEKYLEEHLVYHEAKDEHVGKVMDGYWSLNHDDMNTIAFISWAKRNV